MAKYIKKKHLKEAVMELSWYHIDNDGKLVSGGYSEYDAFVKYSEVKQMVKELPTRKVKDSE